LQINIKLVEPSDSALTHFDQHPEKIVADDDWNDGAGQ